jgi:hypothetical protein
MFCLIFAASIGMTHSQITQGPAAILSSDNISEYTSTADSDSPDAKTAEPSGSTSQAGKLTMVASPNPFTSSTEITCDLPDKGKLMLGIRNMFGETVKTIEIIAEQEGSQSIEVTSEHLRPGIYTAMLVFKTSDNVMMKTIRIVYTK